MKEAVASLVEDEAAIGVSRDETARPDEGLTTLARHAFLARLHVLNLNVFSTEMEHSNLAEAIR